MSPARDWTGPRLLALYAVSAHAALHALVAWSEPGTAPVAAALLGLAAAQAAGVAGTPAALAHSDVVGRRRGRLVARASWGCVAVLVLSVALAAGSASAMGTAARLFVLAQAVLLALAFLEPRARLTLINGFVLVALAALRGGSVATGAVCGMLALLPFVLAYEHFDASLHGLGARRADLLATATSGAARLAVPPALLAAALLGLASPSAWTPARLIDARGRPQVEQAYREALLLGFVGGAVILAMIRLTRRRQAERPALGEPVEPESVVDEPLPPEPAVSDDPLPGGNRGRVIRAYLRVLTAARRRGWRRVPGWSAGAILATLGGLGDGMAKLTERFEAARYGPLEPAEHEAAAAETAAAALARRRWTSIRRGSAQGADVNT